MHFFVNELRDLATEHSTLKQRYKLVCYWSPYLNLIFLGPSILEL